MRDLLETVESWLGEGTAMARAVVIRTYGSAPRREGGSMLRAADGRLAGSVSGGCVEGATAEYLAEAAASGRQRVVRFGVSDEEAWAVGLACGGTIDVLVQPQLPPATLAAARATVRDAVSGQAVVHELPAGTPGPHPGAAASAPPTVPNAPLIVHGDGRLEGSLGDTAADCALVLAARAALARDRSEIVTVAGRQLFIETFAVRPRLVVVGAVEVAVALTRLARVLGWETVLIDARTAFATRERFPDAGRIVIGWPDEVADDLWLGPRDAVAVLSHDPKFDDPAITVALGRGCSYVGAIGSRKTQRARRERLLAAGLEAEQLDRLCGPIGLDLGGREPAEVALAILAEIIARRHGGSGRSMAEESSGSGTAS